MIYKEIEKNSNNVLTPRTVPSSDSDPLSQLEALARLRDQGAITSAEYETKKQELLGRL